MTQNRLKLLIDHTFGPPVVKKLNQIGSIKAISTVEFGLPQYTDDPVIIREMSKKNYLLLTHDHNTINERIYKPCTHGGIIIIMGRWSVDVVFKRMKAFCECGKRKTAFHCVTRLYEDKAIIFKHFDIVDIVDF